MASAFCHAQSRISAPTADIPNSVVKSAGRALQILEFFDEVQREVSVSEISRALQYPQSSTSVLLRSLVSMGYLQHDRYARTYVPTRRVSLLGNWVDPSLVQHGALLEIAKTLARRTGQTVVMATTNGLHAQYIYIQRSEGAKEEYGALAIGAMRPIAHTAVGGALLSAYSDQYVERLIRRINSERPAGDDAIVVPEFLEQLRISAKRGYFIGAGGNEGDGAIAGILDRDRQHLGIAVEGPEADLIAQQDDIAIMLREAAAHYSAWHTDQVAA